MSVSERWSGGLIKLNKPETSWVKTRDGQGNIYHVTEWSSCTSSTRLMNPFYMIQMLYECFFVPLSTHSIRTLSMSVLLCWMLTRPHRHQRVSRLSQCCLDRFFAVMWDTGLCSDSGTPAPPSVCEPPAPVWSGPVSYRRPARLWVESSRGRAQEGWGFRRHPQWCL